MENGFKWVMKSEEETQSSGLFCAVCVSYQGFMLFLMGIKNEYMRWKCTLEKRKKNPALSGSEA